MEKVESNSSFFNEYLNKNHGDFNNCILQLLKNYPDGGRIELQIIDKTGSMLLSSSVVTEKKITTSDYKKAVKGDISTWVGFNPDTNEKVMAASGLLTDYQSNSCAVLRFVASLETIDQLILELSLILIVIGLFILIFIWVSVMHLGKTIIRPVKEMTTVARKMAKGQFSESIQKHYNDELGELADTLNFMATETIKAQELKNEFISSISHELRTPLTSIKGWTETILTGDFQSREETEKGLKVILKEADRLKNMVDDLLDFSRLESGKLILSPEKTDLKQELDEIIGFTTPRALKERISICFEATDNIPQTLVDKNRIRQVIINILDNAIKFSPPQSSIIFKLFHSNGQIIIKVADHGCGIPKEDLPRVKDKFYKGHSKKAGSGIGLAVCEEILKLHGGGLEIASQKGKGTTVTIILPVSTN